MNEIKESGMYRCNPFGHWKWDINYSSILTKLIQEAGRWCEHYASDLFILWEIVRDSLDYEQIETNHYVFAFRDMGVDEYGSYERNKGTCYYYRAVWFLDLEVNDGTLTMTLHK